MASRVSGWSFCCCAYEIAAEFRLSHPLEVETDKQTSRLANANRAAGA